MSSDLEDSEQAPELDSGPRHTTSVPEATRQEDELPIELISLTDRFIDSLTAKVHSTPPSIDRLSTLFQDFYARAASPIATHISTLSSRQHRDSSPSSPLSSRSSSILSKASRTASFTSKDPPRPSPIRTASEQQMLTPGEIAERKKARKALEDKRVALEEAVERRACEKIYNRIYRHRSTDDAERDDKLRSRTAALAVVGIGLKELGIEVDEDGKASQERDEKVKLWLEDARLGLSKMSDEQYPKGKLDHLEAAHKSIVDTLSHFRSSSSSADEILPTLIYTLITAPTEGLDVISNFNFIQRFRSVDKIDGEAAYCLTNLEAAITFLETVDLASLREDEALSGPPRSSSRPATPLAHKTNGLPTATSTNSSIPRPENAAEKDMPKKEDDGTSIKSGNEESPKNQPAAKHQRRISSLLQPPSQALGAASDAVITTADQGIKTISNSLETSYKFLFGRLKEHQVSSAGLEGKHEVVVPKTLDEARRLVSATPPVDDETGSIASSTAQDPIGGQTDGAIASVEEKSDTPHLRRDTRERSVDSIKSTTSSRRVAFVEGGTTEARPSPTDRLRQHLNTPTNASPSLPPTNPAVESMRSLGNTLNPLNRLSGINVMRSFGRREQLSPGMAGRRTPSPNKEASDAELGEVAELTAAFPDLVDSLPPKQKIKIDPPIRRFLDIDNPGDLKISEVLQLLRDYRRLAGVLRDMEAF